MNNASTVGISGYSGFSAYSSDPHIQFLYQVLEEIEGGYLLVPRFQRPRVWLLDRRLELLRSIWDGIPVGSIMVWRTNYGPIECYDRIGPYPLRRRVPVVPRQYILDGVQRLSTLYGALYWRAALTYERNDESLESDDEGEEYFRTYFDLESNEFIEAPGDADEASWLPMDILLDSLALLKFQRLLPPSRSDEWVVRSDALARAFREYKVPIIPITTDSLELATLTFQRINSQGVVMSDLHMLHALTWSQEYDLQSDLKKAKEELLASIGWVDIDDDPILKTCKAALDVDLYKVEIQLLSKLIKQCPGTVRNAVKDVAVAAQFLRTRCMAGAPELVPYSLQIVFLAEAARLMPDFSEEPQRVELLNQWFWFTTYSEAFTGISDDRVRTALGDLRSMVQSGNPVWRLPARSPEFSMRKRFDFRSARSKAFVLALARMRDRFPTTDGTDILLEYGRRAVVQIIPAKELDRDRDAYSSPGNRFLVRPEEVTALRSEILGGMPINSWHSLHGVAEDAIEYLRRRDFVGFIRVRHEYIHEEESRRVVQVFNTFGKEVRIVLN